MPIKHSWIFVWWFFLVLMITTELTNAIVFVSAMLFTTLGYCAGHDVAYRQSKEANQK